MCGLLASDLRRELLIALGSAGPLDVSSLAKWTKGDVAQVSRDLGTLLDEGLVEVERQAKRRIYSLSSRVQFRGQFRGRVSLRIAGNNSHVLQITQRPMRRVKG
jgi:DNA-binding transcriptional ArsR family regulator